MDQFTSFVLHHWHLSLVFGIILLILLILELRVKVSGIPKVSPAQTTQMLNHEEGIVLDIRDEKSFANGHILGSINILWSIKTSANDLSKKFAALNAHLAKPIIIVDNVGQHCLRIATVLRKQGFAKVYILDGGMQNWSNAGLPSTKD